MDRTQIKLKYMNIHAEKMHAFQKKNASTELNILFLKGN